MNNITGDQIGAYFGYSLASGDLDGDGRDDVIIGAPMWTNYEIMGKYETGRVYVVYQGDQVTTISVASKLKINSKKMLILIILFQIFQILEPVQRICYLRWN